MTINWFEDQLSLNAGESIAESSKGSILQYFQPSLSYHLSLRSLFVYFWVTNLHRFYCTTVRFTCVKAQLKFDLSLCIRVNPLVYKSIWFYSKDHIRTHWKLICLCAEVLIHWSINSFDSIVRIILEHIESWSVLVHKC